MCVPGDDQRLAAEKALEGQDRQMEIGDVGRLDDVVGAHVQAGGDAGEAEGLAAAALATVVVELADRPVALDAQIGRHLPRAGAEPAQRHFVAAAGESLGELVVAVLDAADEVGVDRVVKDQDTHSVFVR